MNKTFTYILIYVLILVVVHVGCQNNSEKESSQKNRVISLAPHITEIIYALHAQDQLVAVTDFCRYPEEAQSKEKIGGLLNPNIEKMVSLKPTHLIGLPSHEKLGLELEKFGFTVTMIPNETISDVLKSINEIGKMLNHQIQATNLQSDMQKTLDSLKLNKIDHLVSAVLMIGREKGTLRNIMVAGKNTYLDELWQLVGGVNTYSDLPTRYGSINLESLLLRNPDLIIEFDLEKIRQVSRIEVSKEWDYLGDITAVKNRNVFEIGGNHTMIPGPRLIWLAKDFRKIIERVEIPQQ